jgi:hypothetical protein
LTHFLLVRCILSAAEFTFGEQDQPPREKAGHHYNIGIDDRPDHFAAP